MKIEEFAWFCDKFSDRKILEGLALAYFHKTRPIISHTKILKRDLHFFKCMCHLHIIAISQPNHRLVLKYYCQEFSKDAEWRISAEKARTVIFAPDLTEDAFAGVSFSDAKMYGRRALNWITQHDLLTFAFVKLLVFALSFNVPKKHVLKQAVICSGHYGNDLSVFFNMCIVSKSPAEFPLPSVLLWNCALTLICPV